MEGTIHKVNTGCHYGKAGQQITIAIREDRAFFFDHSRMVEGMVEGTGLTVEDVIKGYVRSTYSDDMYEHISSADRYEIRDTNYGPDAADDFEDISAEYGAMVRRGFWS